MKHRSRRKLKSRLDNKMNLDPKKEAEQNNKHSNCRRGHNKMNQIKKTTKKISKVMA